MSLRQSKLYVSLPYSTAKTYQLIPSPLLCLHSNPHFTTGKKLNSSFGPKAPLVASSSNGTKDSEKNEKPVETHSTANASDSTKVEVADNTAMDEDNETGKPAVNAL